jgi:hypothetical protein
MKYAVLGVAVALSLLLGLLIKDAVADEPS